MSAIEVIGFGAINYDHLLLVDSIVVDGEQVVKSSFIQPGGSAANTVFGLAKLGVNCGFIGAVGSDTQGKAAIKDFTKAGIDTSRIAIKKNAKTGKTTCISDNDNKRSIYIQPGANNDIDETDIDYNYVNQSRILHISSFANINQFILQSGMMSNISDDIHIGFSPGIIYARKGIDALSSILRKTCMLFVNRDEIEAMTKTNFLSSSKQCMEAGCKYVIVTMGKGYIKDGEQVICVITDPVGQYEITVPHKTIINNAESTGAGDAFAAGFIFGYLNKKDIAECAILGHITAISTLKSIGARQGLPDLNRLTKSYFKLLGTEL